MTTWENVFSILGGRGGEGEGELLDEFACFDPTPCRKL
jgi:hypothetical protein